MLKIEHEAEYEEASKASSQAIRDTVKYSGKSVSVFLKASSQTIKDAVKYSGETVWVSIAGVVPKMHFVTWLHPPTHAM